jgi:hypothetical protein
MTDQAIVTAPQQAQDNHWLAPVATIAQAIARYQLMAQFTKEVMVQGHDYGIIPGTDKPTLLKPGAEKLNSFFGLAPTFEPIQTIIDVTGKDHDGEPFLYFQYRCTAYVGGNRIAEGIGSCNSWEKKYRYRNADRVCPTCGKPTIFKSKNKPEFYCWQKKGGCGATFPLTDKRITDQETGQIKNPDVCELLNTIDKMAQKRALVAATLIATNASDHYTQDLEDFFGNDTGEPPIEATARNAAPAQPPAPATPPAQAPASAPMTLAEAEAVTNSEGKTYGSLDSAKLSYMANSLGKIAKRTPEQETKLLAIQIIMASRAAAAMEDQDDAARAAFNE